MYWREGVSVGPDDNFSVVRFRSPLFASPLPPLRIRKAVMEGPMATPPSPFIPTHFTVNQACVSASLRSGKEGGKPEPTKSSSLKHCCFCNAASSQNYKNICFFRGRNCFFSKERIMKTNHFFVYVVCLIREKLANTRQTFFFIIVFLFAISSKNVYLCPVQFFLSGRHNPRNLGLTKPPGSVA